VLAYARNISWTCPYVCSVFHLTVTLTFKYITATMTLEHSVAYDIILVLVTSVALLTSLTVIRRNEYDVQSCLLGYTAV
jgi:hypothetical protein